MGKNSGIAWTDHSNNPWQGCKKESEGCTHCYMFRDKKRYGQDPKAIVRSKDKTFNQPLRWKDPAKIFVCSWSDFFLEEADAWREEYWDIIRASPQHTFLLLTKRAYNIQDRLPEDWGEGYKNVWLGITAENQKRFDERMEILKEIPARIRFVSAEPLLEPLDVRSYKNAIDWLIIAGESGSKARPFDMVWVDDLLYQCAWANIVPFVKQMGSNPFQDGESVSFSSRNGEDPEEWPEAFRIRQFPSLEEKYGKEA